MRDQAERLRQIINGIKTRQDNNQVALISDIAPKSARVITVTSGKGGVGKTNITINLGIALSELGLRVVILDADFGLANIDVLFGITPKSSLDDVIHDRKNILEILADGPRNIKFISGGSGVEDLVKLDKTQLERFVSNIALLDKIADVILIDTGAGLSDNVMSFVMAADEVLLVTTPEPTSITDAYALVKMIANHDKNKTIKVIVNRADNANEASDLLNKLSVASERFLSLKLYKLGYILQDDAVSKAVKMQQPFSISFPKSHASRYVKEISKKLADTKTQQLSQSETIGFKGFVNRLVSFLNA
jgi:flagellar biosynthesis protein FlhG